MDNMNGFPIRVGQDPDLAAPFANQRQQRESCYAQGIIHTAGEASNSATTLGNRVSQLPQDSGAATDESPTTLGLTSLPSVIANLQERLDLDLKPTKFSGLGLTSLPPEIRNLANLQERLYFDARPTS